MGHLKQIDWAIIGGYAWAVVTVCADAAFPQLFDTITGVFGAPPGLGHKIFTVAGGLIGLAALVTGRIQAAQTRTVAADATIAAAAPATAITENASVVPSGTTIVTEDTAKVPLNPPTPP